MADQVAEHLCDDTSAIGRKLAETGEDEFEDKGKV